MCSETDNRVLRYLSTGPKRTAAVGRECFAQEPGRRKNTVLVAASHLRKMEARGLVVCSDRESKSGLLWRVADDAEKQGQGLLF